MYDIERLKQTFERFETVKVTKIQAIQIVSEVLSKYPETTIYGIDSKQPIQIVETAIQNKQNAFDVHGCLGIRYSHDELVIGPPYSIGCKPIDVSLIMLESR